jgi:cell division protein FtsW
MPKPAVQKLQHFDKSFFGVVLTICIIGLFIFISASLGILAHSESKFYSVLFSQFALGYTLGFAALIGCLKIPYTFWRKYALYIFIFGLILTTLVFVPHLGFAHGGARRWLVLGPISFQPAEFLKIAFVMYFASWLAWFEKKKKENNGQIVPFVIMISITAVVLLLQPDTKSLILIAGASSVMLFVSGIHMKKIFIIFGTAVVLFGGLLFIRPYTMNRVKTFLNPSADPRGASYQVQQSLIAIGSGGMFGKGLGQSIQKFNYLPEPQGDSIFAVYAEEFGFLGTFILVCLYLFFSIRGYGIAFRAPDPFSRFLVVGLVTLLVTQSFLNIVSIVGLFPLTGVPLVFVSQGGSALLFALLSVGIILQISRYKPAS